MTFQGEAVNEVLDAPKGFALTKETRVFKKTEDGVREIAAISDLQDGQSIEVWTHFLSDHLLGAAEITIIDGVTAPIF
ncbi:hypothetical protein E6C60_0304 [Paenibacillus algicola]|uniref:Uncharacterized protein n=1 Tax=Paenibacillus algicola TaxID=2565926 RepID=A0A4P8XLH7_9BACL|nr:hypothetical protein E6C60_0304 [Paenibacillus algicola]